MSVKQSQWIMVSLMLLCALPLMAVEVSPDQVSFETRDQQAVLTVSSGGKPVAVTGHQLLAGNSNYSRMINLKAADGKVTLSLTPQAEIGSYTLVLKTAEGDASVKVFTPLTSLESSIKQRAAAQNISEEEYRAQLGIRPTILYERVELNLPPVMYLGQTLTVPFSPVKGREYEWKVNGETVRSGGAESARLEYTFMKTGEYTFHLEEKEGGRAVVSATDMVKVVHEPAAQVSVVTSRMLRLAAPEGYDRLIWTLDGNAAGNGKIWSASWSEAGTHLLELRCANPVSSALQELRLITWHIEVTPGY